MSSNVSFVQPTVQNSHIQFMLMWDVEKQQNLKSENLKPAYIWYLWALLEWFICVDWFKGLFVALNLKYTVSNKQVYP